MVRGQAEYYRNTLSSNQTAKEHVSDYYLHKHFRDCWHGTCAFLRNELDFFNCIKDGHYYMYYKPDLLSLNKELKEKNIDLSRYMEYRRDEADFERKMKKVEEEKKKLLHRKTFRIPDDVKDITTSMILATDPQLEPYANNNTLKLLIARYPSILKQHLEEIALLYIYKTNSLNGKVNCGFTAIARLNIS